MARAATLIAPRNERHGGLGDWQGMQDNGYGVNHSVSLIITPWLRSEAAQMGRSGDGHRPASVRLSKVFEVSIRIS